jgi:nucleotide-binding universal stress UspA family protein
MKTILAPTDFSTISSNSIAYAAHLAFDLKAKLILFHVCNSTIVPSEIPITLPSKELEEEGLKKLEHIKSNLHQKHGDLLDVECKCVSGFPIEDIVEFADENNVDLIVMGLEETGFLTQLFIGNIATSVIRHTKHPVLVVNENLKYHKIKKVVLACDYKELKHVEILNPLIELINIFKSEFHLLNIISNTDNKESVDQTISEIKIDHLLMNIDHVFHQIKDEDIVEGINNFADENEMDLVVMIPRMHNMFHRLIFESTTKQMAFHTHKPLLTLHE